MDEIVRAAEEHPECFAGRAVCVEKAWFNPALSQKQHYVEILEEVTNDDGAKVLVAVAACGYAFNGAIVFTAHAHGPFKPCKLCERKVGPWRPAPSPTA